MPVPTYASAPALLNPHCGRAWEWETQSRGSGCLVPALGRTLRTPQRPDLLSLGLIGAGTEPSEFGDHNHRIGPAGPPRCDP